MGGHRKSQRRATDLASPARVTELLRLLQAEWGHAVCELDHADAYQLIVATILSAQSTDKRVNLVTPALFRRFPSAAALGAADQSAVEQVLHETGFCRNKTRKLRGMARTGVAADGGRIPRTMDELVQLPGVARKTANVVLGTAFGIASGVVVDTHIKRLANRLALTTSSNPVQIERDLMAAIPRDRWIDLGHQLIWHGRRICDARAPQCERCPLVPVCPSAEVA